VEARIDLLDITATAHMRILLSADGQRARPSADLVETVAVGDFLKLFEGFCSTSVACTSVSLL
jgi:hypothetical protein